MPQRGSLLPYRGVLSFLSKAREASGSEAPRLHHASRGRSGGVAARGAGAAAAMPVVGFLEHQYALHGPVLLRAFRQGLSETGYVEGETLRSYIAGRSVK